MVVDSAVATKAAEARERQRPTGGPGRILVIEDDIHLREIMEVLISIEGCEPRSAADGAEALEIILAWEPDLILLDLYMPGMDGREFLAAYRQRGGKAPVIVLSGGAETVDPAELGVAGVLSKPFDVTDLLDMVAQFTDCAGD